MSDSTSLALTGYLGQAACAVLIAVVLQMFHRHYRREYLRHWAWSWWAFAVYLLCAAAGLYLRGMPAMSPVRLGFSTLALLGGYGQICWLLFGTYEVATGKTVPRHVSRWVLGALLVLAPLTVLATADLSGTARLMSRLGIRVLMSGLAFCAAAWGILRGRLRTAGLGRKLMGGAFLLYGLDQLQYFGGFVAHAWLNRSMDYMNLLSGLDLLLQAVMGMGMVIWLLEEERGYLMAAAEQIEHLAYHDTLTGLPNRNLFMDHLRLALALAHRDRRSVAVLFLDLDRFKTINDSLGHSAGDELLRIVASRLRIGLRDGDTVARLGGDELAVVLPAVEDERAAVRVAEKILDLVRRPLILHDREIVVTCSIGISLFPRDDQASEELLKKADIAMYQAKQRGRDAFQVYLPTMDADALERLSLENDLRRALAHEELCLYYQPILDCRTGRIEAVEALLRWHHPQRGLMRPGEFLPIAEHAGLSKPIDLWVLHTACREIRSWHQAGADVRVTVNLSARPFQQRDLIVQVQNALEEAGLAASFLEARNHRDPGHAERRGEPGSAARPQGPRPAHRHRRLRYRVFLSVVPADLPDRHAEDRRVLRPLPERRGGRPCRDPGGDHRPRPQPPDPGRGRRGRGRSAVASPAREGLRRGPGLLLQPPHPGGRMPGADPAPGGREGEREGGAGGMRALTPGPSPIRTPQPPGEGRKSFKPVFDLLLSPLSRAGVSADGRGGPGG